MKAITDKKLAEFVDSRLQIIHEHTLQLGRAVQESLTRLERIIEAQMELKQALRDGIYQPLLSIRDQRDHLLL